MRLGKRGFVLAGVIVIVALVVIGALVAMNWEKLTGGVLYPVEANRQFLAVSFSCANGAESQLTSKNCRSAAYWKNFADKFCRNLCEPTEDMNLDNLNVGNDHSCDIGEIHLFKECEGNVVQPVGAGSVLIGGDCTEDAECTYAAYCQGAPYGTCQYTQNVPTGGACAMDGQCADDGVCENGICAIRTTTTISTTSERYAGFYDQPERYNQESCDLYYYDEDYTGIPIISCSCAPGQEFCDRSPPSNDGASCDGHGDCINYCGEDGVCVTSLTTVPPTTLPPETNPGMAGNVILPLARGEGGSFVHVIFSKFDSLSQVDPGWIFDKDIDSADFTLENKYPDSPEGRNELGRKVQEWFRNSEWVKDEDKKKENYRITTRRYHQVPSIETDYIDKEPPSTWKARILIISKEKLTENSMKDFTEAAFAVIPPKEAQVIAPTRTNSKPNTRPALTQISASIKLEDDCSANQNNVVNCGQNLKSPPSEIMLKCTPHMLFGGPGTPQPKKDANGNIEYHWHPSFGQTQESASTCVAPKPKCDVKNNVVRCV